MMTVKELASLDDCKEFFRSLKITNPFCSGEWLDIFVRWRDSLSLTGKPFLLGVYKDEELCGLAPFSRDTMKIKGILPVRVIRFLHTTYSDYCDFVSKEGLHADVYGAVLEFLRMRADWDILWLREIAQWSETASLLPGLLEQQGYHYFSYPCTNCYRIVLPSSWDDYYGKMSQGRRANMRNYRNRLERIGKVDFGVAPANELAEGLTSFFHLHQKKWKSEGKPGVFANQAVREIFYNHLYKMGGAGMLRLFYLKLNNDYIAASIRFACGNTLYGWLTGYDPEYESLRVGTLLHHETIRYAIDNGFATYDLMRGEHKYKKDFGGTLTPNVAYGIARSRIKLRVFEVLEKLAQKRKS